MTPDFSRSLVQSEQITDALSPVADFIAYVVPLIGLLFLPK